MSSLTNVTLFFGVAVFTDRFFQVSMEMTLKYKCKIAFFYVEFLFMIINVNGIKKKKGK